MNALGWHVSGAPTDAEVAAVVAALTAASTTPPSAPTTTSADDASGWSAYWRRLRTPLPVGTGAWRASGLPRT